MTDKYEAWRTGGAGYMYAPDGSSGSPFPKQEPKDKGLDRLLREWEADEVAAAALPKTMHVAYSAERAWNGEPVFVVTDPVAKEVLAFMDTEETDLPIGKGEMDVPVIIDRRFSEKPTEDNIFIADYSWQAPTRRRQCKGVPARPDTWAMALVLRQQLRESLISS